MILVQTELQSDRSKDVCNVPKSRSLKDVQLCALCTSTIETEPSSNTKKIMRAPNSESLPGPQKYVK